MYACSKEEPSWALPGSETSSTYPHGSNFQSVVYSAEEIQRPRSALHSGIFSEGSNKAPQHSRAGENFPANTSPDYLSGLTVPSGTIDWSSSWFHSLPKLAQAENSSTERRPLRNRAPSLTSYSTGYVLKAPTTPLVQQSSVADFEPNSPSPTHGRSSPDRSKRRHTLPPHALQAKVIPSIDSSLSLHSKGEEDYHVPQAAFGQSYGHRSISAAWSPQQSISKQSPDFHKHRRQSFGSETSPLQRASMVGSYEESIIHGWMSTPPSKPLDFTAKIGALGKGECKPKFPPHTMTPFPAVFYSWSNDFTRRTDADSEPSPYVGTIDLQNQRPVRDRDDTPNISTNGRHSGESHAAKRKRRSTDSGGFNPPPGNYRIPEQGQLQIVIQNPNKTAVKLFIVPYDLTGMEPRTKTFIRQRSSSNVANEATFHNERAQNGQKTKQKLRYMIHLNICCTARGRFYLYHQIRVVFANRVPDNKEQLHCETLVPSPRFTPYHPPRLSAPTSTMGTPLSRPTVPLSLEGVSAYSLPYNTGHGVLPLRMDTPPPPVPAIPFSLATSQREKEDQGNQCSCSSCPEAANRAYPGQIPSVELILPNEEAPRPATTNSPSFDIPWALGNSSDTHGDDDDSTNATAFERLSENHQPYGSPYGRPHTPQAGEGIWAKTLRNSRVSDSKDIGRIQ